MTNLKKTAAIVVCSLSLTAAQIDAGLLTNGLKAIVKTLQGAENGLVAVGTTSTKNEWDGIGSENPTKFELTNAELGIQSVPQENHFDFERHTALANELNQPWTATKENMNYWFGRKTLTGQTTPEALTENHLGLQPRQTRRLKRQVLPSIEDTLAGQAIMDLQENGRTDKKAAKRERKRRKREAKLEQKRLKRFDEYRRQLIKDGIINHQYGF